MKATIKTRSAAGFEVVFEVPDMENRIKLLEILPRFEAELLEAGYEPTTDQQTIVNVEQAAAVPPVPSGPLSFPVDKIAATVDDGKAYWRVKGGEFQKFGVVVYDEVLAAAGLGELNPLKAYSEPGLVAVYTTKEDGKPKKVIRFERQ